jgi:LEA14-like dessication related protein
MIVLWIVLAFNLGGCQYLKELFGPVLQRPQITIKDIQVVSTTLFELKIKIRFLVENPNSFELEFSNLNYDVGLSKRRVAFGVYKENFKLPAEQNTTIDIPLTIASLEAVQILRDVLRKKGKLELELTGAVDFHSAFGAMTINFDHKKELF